jgi:type IV secretory pathway TraG/TraD family ATPase VirD4
MVKRISPEFAARLTGNCSSMYAFLQKNGESAEEIAKYSGTSTVWKETIKSERFLFWNLQTGDRSLREVEEFNIHPNQIKSLKVGECVVVKKYPKSTAYKMRVKFSG